MKLLAVECTASPVSVALYEDGCIKAEYFLNQKITHSQTLMPMCENMLKVASVSVSDIDCFAVTAGPGSFTGVRIGISAIKGLAQPSMKPCVAVSVLEAMANTMIATDCYTICAMDARCNQVYNALFSIDNSSVTRLCDDRALMVDELLLEIEQLHKEHSDKRFFVIGDGADLVFNAATHKGLEFVELSPEHLKWQRASGVAMVAEKMYNEGRTVSATELLPFYLRLPQAQRELNKKKKQI